MEIYLVRHTRVSIQTGICYGQFDVPLCGNFLQDFARIKEKLPADFNKVFSSPSTRCRLLAEHISPCPAEYHDSLMEMNFGNWENKAWDSLEQKQLNHWMDNFVYVETPQGESLLQLYQRVALFLDSLRSEKYEKVALITHAGVIRCIWSYILDLPLKNIFKIPVDYGDGMVVRLAEQQKLDTIIKTCL